MAAEIWMTNGWEQKDAENLNLVFGKPSYLTW